MPNADAYQLVMDCHRLGLTTGHRVYAAGEPQPEPFDIVGNDVRLVVHALDLQLPIADLESAVASLARDMLQGSACRAVGLALHREVY